MKISETQIAQKRKDLKTSVIATILESAESFEKDKNTLKDYVDEYFKDAKVNISKHMEKELEGGAINEENAVNQWKFLMREAAAEYNEENKDDPGKFSSDLLETLAKEYCQQTKGLLEKKLGHIAAAVGIVPEKEIKEFEISDVPEVFMLREGEDFSLGAGETLKAALEDAMLILAGEGWKIPPELLQEVEHADNTPVEANLQQEDPAHKIFVLVRQNPPNQIKQRDSETPAQP